MIELPEIRISILVDIFYTTDTTIAAGPNPYVQLPYAEFSEVRDFLWKSILKDTTKFKLCSFKPSDKGEPDRTRLRAIFPIKDSDPEVYEQQIEEYLKTQPNSQSFYMVANALNSSGTPITRWIIDCRISNHTDSSKSRSESSLQNTLDFFDKKFNNGKGDSILIPTRIKLSYRTVQNYQAQYTEYKLDLSEVSNNSIICSNVTEIKSEIQKYFQHLWNICNEFIPPDVFIVHKNIEGSTRYDGTYDVSEIISDILLDLEAAIAKYSNNLEEFYGYTWECISADVEDSEIKRIYIRDNFGEDFVIYSDIDIEYYYNNYTYRNMILHDISISVLEGYDTGY